MKILSKNFAQRLQWPINVPEDAYTYFKLKELGLRVKKQKGARAYMRNVTNFNDQIKQSTKFQSGKEALKNYFPVSLLDNEYSVPPTLIFTLIAKELILSPFWFSLYLIEVAINRILTLKADKFNALYEPYVSSKKLTDNLNN